MAGTIDKAAEERRLAVGELSLNAYVGGSGPPLLLLHRDIGNPGWDEFASRLSESFTVYQPSHAGYDKSDRPDWLRGLKDMAILYLAALRQWDLGPLRVVGLGLGGWIAADMATMDPSSFERMVLISPAGIKPTQGEIFDQVLFTATDWVRTMFDDQTRFDDVYGAEPDPVTLMSWMSNQEMTARIAWSPWLYDQTLPHLLGFADVETLVLWSTDDRIIPSACGVTYSEKLPRATLEMLDGASHVPEIERPEVTARRVVEFLSGRN